MNNTVRQKKTKNINSSAAGEKIKPLGEKICCRPKSERTCQHCYKPAYILSLASFINTVLEWLNMRKNTPYICVCVCKARPGSSNSCISLSQMLISVLITCITLLT